MPGRKSVTQHPETLEGAERRIRELLDGGLPQGGLGTEAPPAGERTSRSARGGLGSLSTREMLESNPPAAVAGRLRRMGLAPQTIEAVTAGRTREALEGPLSAGQIGLERILGRNELLAIRYLDGGQRAGRAVCRVVIRSASGTVLGYGTGSLVSPGLVLTNNHVLDSQTRAGRSSIEFDYQLSLRGDPLTKVTFALRPDLFFVTSPETELDMTLVAVAATSQSQRPLTDYSFNPLSALADEILAGESVTIIQHPGGDLKQIALRENRVLKLPDTRDRYLYYETDTTPGSSGAPVFNDQWEVIALHHSGFPQRDEQGRILTPEGDLWQEWMGDTRINWLANEGIRVAAIRDFLTSLSGLNAEAGRLRDDALNPPERSAGDEVDDRIPPAPPQLPAGQPIRQQPGIATWTIPLTVSVTVGAPPVPAQPIPSPHPVAPFPPPFDDTEPTADPDDTDVDAARAEVERHRDQLYYDADADQTARDAYYTRIAADLDPAELYDALSDLVSSTHVTELSYKPMIHLYPWVDLQSSRKINSVYSHQEFDPLELINRDFEVATLRRERMSSFRAREASPSPVAEAVFLEALEAQLPYNCEHVVPQSWFAKRQPMKGDLHHLFACESGCNSFRNNIPYFDFTDFGEATRSSCGKRETNKFEPENGKGPIARATLYFLLRYPGEVHATSSEYTPERIATLLAWHRDHGVTDYERHRNQAIFAVQGNRNPLIDFPEWAGEIEFLRGLG